MANTNTLNTRLLLCCDTTANWTASTKVLLKSEMAIEFPESGTPKIKVGNGVDTWTDLPYLAMTPEEINTLISALDAVKHSHSNMSVLNATTASFTTELKTKLDGITDSADSVSFSRSVTSGTKIATITINGAATDIYVPTDKNTTYDLGATASSTNGNVKINLTGSNSTTDSVSIKGSGATTVTTDSNGVITVSSTDTKYTHPSSGVIAGTYKSVTVNAQGHVTAGTNPTTLSGYGITDAAAKSHTHDASAITSGTISIDRLPHGALERCVVVADDTARFALTTSSVQTGDTVKVSGTGKMYFVVDDSNLSTEAGYEVYTAGSATSVPWSGITGKPSTFTPSDHTQAISTITGLQAALDGKAANTDMTGATSSAAGTHGLVPAPAAGKQGQYLRGDGTWATPTNTTYSDATQSTHGLMSVADKKKLDGIEEGANNYVHPTTSGNKHIPSGGSSGQILRWSADGTAVWGADNNTTYSAGTGLSLSGTTFNHSNSVTAGTAQGDASKTLSFGGTFTIPTVSYDAQGHVTGKGTTTMTMPATPTTVSGNAGSATKLQNARTISLGTAVTATATSFNGTANITIPVTALNAMYLTVASTDTLILNGGSAS